MKKDHAITLVVSLLLLGVGFGGGYWRGQQTGYASGFSDGQRNGEVKAARSAPPATRDRGHTLEQLSATEAWAALPELAEGEAAALVQTVNQAPTPCGRAARRGVSVATALVLEEHACISAPGSLRLGLAALRSFPDDPGEAVAVLRVEKRVAPNIEGRARRGNPDADIVVVEWSDFQCPYCTRAAPVIDELLEARDDVAVVYKHFPLSFHPAALPAALAAEAAGRQGRFWEMHDALFALGKGIGDRVDKKGTVAPEGPVPFEDLAKDLGLDVERFRSDLRSDEVAAVVQADQDEAKILGVGGTPTFFVADRRVRERLTAASLSALVDKARGERDLHFSWDLAPAPR